MEQANGWNNRQQPVNPANERKQKPTAAEPGWLRSRRAHPRHDELDSRKKPCPWSRDPQGEIDADVAKIRDHYGPDGVDELRKVVKELENKKP